MQDLSTNQKFCYINTSFYILGDQLAAEGVSDPQPTNIHQVRDLRPGSQSEGPISTGRNQEEDGFLWRGQYVYHVLKYHVLVMLHIIYSRK